MNRYIMEQNRREQQPFTVPRRPKRYYGSEQPVPTLRSRLSKRKNLTDGLTILIVLVVVAACVIMFFLVLPDAVDQSVEHSREVVSESLLQRK